MTHPGLSIEEIRRLLPHRYPFLLIDKVTDLIPGERGVGIKCVTANEPFFQGHFPQRLIMPGVLIVEACGQLAGLVQLSMNPSPSPPIGVRVEYLASIQKFNFKHIVCPGDQLTIEAFGFKKMQRLVQVTVQARVGNQHVAEGVLILTRQEEGGRSS